MIVTSTPHLAEEGHDAQMYTSEPTRGRGNEKTNAP